MLFLALKLFVRGAQSSPKHLSRTQFFIAWMLAAALATVMR